MKKAVKVLSTAALLASLATPFAVPAYAANTKTIVSSTPSVATDYNSGYSTSAATPANPLTTLTIRKDDLTDNYSGKNFRVILPTGVKFVKENYDDSVPGVQKTVLLENASVVSVTDQVLELKTTAEGDIKVPLYVKVDGATGELKVTVDGLDSPISSGTYTVGYANAGKSNVSVDDVKTIGSAPTTIGAIRIDETSIGALKNDGQAQKITVKLPTNFKWKVTGTSQILFSGGFADVAKNVGDTNAVGTTLAAGVTTTPITSAMIDDRTLTFYVQFPQNAATRGTIYLQNLQVEPTSDASYGDVVASVSGDKVSSQDITIASYKDYSTAVSVTGDVPQLFAGRMDANEKDDIKLGKLQIKENLAGSIIDGRKTRVELPSWVQIVDVKVDKADNVNGGTAALEKAIRDNITGKKNYVEFVVPPATSGKRDMEITFYATSKAASQGDVVAKVSGPSTATGEATIGKVVTPVSISATSTNVRIGRNNQPIGDITITENAKGAILGKVNGANSELKIELDSGLIWNTKPTVKVVEGDIDLDLANISKDGEVLTIPVKGESTKPSKIVLSGGTIDVNRSVAEGDFEVAVKGNAVVQNHKTATGYLGENELKTDNTGKFDPAATANGSSSTVDAGEFDKSSQATAVAVKVVTPAPTDVTASNIVFKLNSKTFTVDGKAQEMDAAPLVGWDRAFLPVRFAANALNVSDSNIIWDDKTSTFTIFKGDRVITGKVGEKFLTVNGVKVPMDVPVWRNKAQTNNRVMVPIRYLANALNASIEWNKETSEITISAAK